MMMTSISEAYIAAPPRYTASFFGIYSVPPHVRQATRADSVGVVDKAGASRIDRADARLGASSNNDSLPSSSAASLD